MSTEQSLHGNGTYPHAHLLVDVEWVEAHASSPHVVVLDARSKGYAEGHIPGAVHIDVKSLKNADQRTFAPAAPVQRLLEQSGVSDGSTVVVYDEGGTVLAARVFYVLEYFGLKDRVKLLDGGFAAWQAAGKPVSVEAPETPRGSLSALSPDGQRVTTKESIQAGLSGAFLLDARSAEEYTGADPRSNRKAGHIEGAVHREWKAALQPPDASGVVRFKAYDQLQQELREAGLRPDRTLVPYCQSNQRGAHAYFVLRLLGYEDIRPYEGSWDEWGNAEDTVVVSEQ